MQRTPLQSRDEISLPSRLLALARRREATLLTLILTVSLSVIFMDPGFATLATWKEILVRCAPTAIVSCGLLLVVVTGEIDISVGSLLGLLAAVVGVTMSQDHWNWSLWQAVPSVLLLGTTIGLLTGFTVTWGNVPSIIVTLGMLTTLRGITTWVMGGRNIDGLPAELERVTKYGYAGLPLSVWIAGIVILATYIMIYHLPIGKRLFALGSSREAARMIGLPAQRLKQFAFAYTGFLTAVATLVDVPRLPTIESGIGVGFELLVVTCVVVGGVAITGGRGNLTGVLLAVVLMTMIRPVLTFLDIGEAGEKWTKAIQGTFIIAAILGDTWMPHSRPKRTRC